MPGKKKEGMQVPESISNIFRYIRNVFGLNIGTVVFTLLLVYLMVSAVVYMTSTHIVTYQVTTGLLSRNETYTGLALHEDIICKSESNGYINYYAREGNRINANGVVYGLSMTERPEADADLTREDLMKIRRTMQSFSKGFDPSRFNASYGFKSQIEGSLLQYVGVTAAVPAGKEGAGQVADSTSNVVLLGNQTLCKSAYDGIVLYSKDGYEGKNLENLRLSDFNQASYHETNLKTSGYVSMGEDIYTVIADEKWSLLIPLSDKQLSRLKDLSTVRVRFLKDDLTQNGSFQIVQVDGANFGRIGFDRGLIRYASDRFLDIELVTNTKTGLKIPLSSIVTKEFLIIPSDFAHDDGSFYVEERGKDGKASRKVVSPAIYASLSNENTTYVPTDETIAQNTYLYVDKSAFPENTVLVKEDSDRNQERYVIGDTSVLEGVYCINQGYAVFRRIEVLAQNDEYAIVAKDTSYGLVRYDHIVRNASQVKEEDILY